MKKQLQSPTDSDVEKVLAAITTLHNDVQDILDEIKIKGSKEGKYLTSTDVKKILEIDVYN